MQESRQKQANRYYIYLNDKRSVVYFGPYSEVLELHKMSIGHSFAGNLLEAETRKQCKIRCRKKNLKGKILLKNLVESNQTYINLDKFSDEEEEYQWREYSRKQTMFAHAVVDFSKFTSVSSEAEFIKKIERCDIINAVDDRGQSLAHHAAHRGYAEALKLLDARFIDLNFQERYGFTALHVAILHNRINVIKFLLSKNVDCTKKINATYRVHDYRHLTPPQLFYLMEVSISGEYLKQVYVNLSYKFPFAKWNGLVMHMGYDESNVLRITDLDFTKYKGSFSINEVSQEFRAKYPNAFDASGELIEGLALRHIKSITKMIEDIKAEWIYKSIEEIRNRVCSLKSFNIHPNKISATKIVEYISNLCYEQIKDENNLFIGNKIENEAFGWLIAELKKLKNKIRRDIEFINNPTKIPQEYQAVRIPPKYQPVFIRHKRYKKLVNLEPHAMFLLKETSQLDMLLRRANYDEIPYACLNPNLLKRKRGTLLLKSSKSI